MLMGQPTGLMSNVRRWIVRTHAHIPGKQPNVAGFTGKKNCIFSRKNVENSLKLNTHFHLNQINARTQTVLNKTRLLKLLADCSSSKHNVRKQTTTKKLQHEYLTSWQ